MTFARAFAIVLLLVALGHATPARAAIIINEILNAVPSTDNGIESIEIKSTLNGVESLAGLSFLAINGESTNGGIITNVLNLGAFSTGSNGLFLSRDSAVTVLPTPNPATIVDDDVAGFTSDLPNNTMSWFLVSGFTGAVNDDLDTNNDGTLDSTPWTAVLDAVSRFDNDSGIVLPSAPDYVYADDVGGTVFAYLPLPQPPVFTVDTSILRFADTNVWFQARTTGPPGVFLGPFPYDAAADVNGNMISLASLSFANASPGNLNPILLAAVPEPGTFVLGAVGALVLFAVRRARRAQRNA